MSIARKLVLLVAMAMAAMAFTAASASAEVPTEVEVNNEHSGDPCSPCNIHIQGESHITALPSGVIVSTCSDEFTGTITNSGGGSITWVGSAHGAPGCNLLNCTTGTEAQWPLSNLAESRSGGEVMSVRFCLRSTAELHCDAAVNITNESSDLGTDAAHHYIFSTTQLCAAGTRRVEGLWEIESAEETMGGKDEIELVHHDTP